MSATYHFELISKIERTSVESKEIEFTATSPLICFLEGTRMKTMCSILSIQLCVYRVYHEAKWSEVLSSFCQTLTTQLHRRILTPFDLLLSCCTRHPTKNIFSELIFKFNSKIIGIFDMGTFRFDIFHLAAVSFDICQCVTTAKLSVGSSN